MVPEPVRCAHLVVYLLPLTCSKKFHRRAKEKLKGGKGPEGALKKEPSQDDALLPYEEELLEEPEEKESSQTTQSTDNGDSSSQSSSPAVTTPPFDIPPPIQHLRPAWDEDSFVNQPNHLSYRRGSLPVNAYYHSPHSPSTVDSFDPLARRRSVDASLQRLATNPYAPLARAKNGALFGPRVLSHGGATRQRPYGQRTVSAMPYRLDIRRASTDYSRSGASPSPSPLTPYNAARASLPGHNLYALATRSIPSPIPGPLPSPNYSFGAASTPSMVSSPGDSERNSPDSFTIRGEDADEDDGPYDYCSRFGSFTSVATSDSSANSTYYSDIASTIQQGEHNHSPEYDLSYDLKARRDSTYVFYYFFENSYHKTKLHNSAPAFLNLMSGLGVNAMHDGIVSPLEHGVYMRDTSNVIRVDGNGRCSESTAYPSPTSTISARMGTSPHDPPPASVPISRSSDSELAYALQSQSDQVCLAYAVDRFPLIPDELYNQMKASAATTKNEQIVYTNPNLAHLTAVSAPPHVQYFYPQEPRITGASNAPVEYEKSRYDPEFAPQAPHNKQYNSSPAYLTEGYPVENHGELSMQHQHMNYHAPRPEVYHAYGEAVAPTMASPLENVIQNVEAFVTYV